MGADVPGTRQKLLSGLNKGNKTAEEIEPLKWSNAAVYHQEKKFDVVSIQFAIHYMMSTRKRARRFFQTISQLLEVGGNLIATTMDARVVLDHMMDLGLDLHFDDDDTPTKAPVVQVGGSACRIQFDGDDVKRIFAASDEDSRFGLDYSTSLLYTRHSTPGKGTDHATRRP